jgi:hypothetical protein
MATRRWSVNTVRRRLVELNRFAGWLVERRHLARSPMIGISIPRRERHLPHVLDWSQIEQIMPEPHRRGGFVSHKMMGRAHLHPGGPALQAGGHPARPARGQPPSVGSFRKNGAHLGEDVPQLGLTE